MKVLFGVVLTLFSVTAMADHGASRVDRREHHQNSRIRQGTKSGELTKHEQRRAARDQKKIHRAEKRAEADGEVTTKEKRHLENMQDRASKDIYRMKHNDKKPESMEPEAGSTELPKPEVEPEEN
jgi:hypothetical protein